MDATISGHLLKRARLTRTTGDAGAVTLIQRILAHLTQRACEEQKDSPVVARAPPQPSLL